MWHLWSATAPPKPPKKNKKKATSGTHLHRDTGLGRIANSERAGVFQISRETGREIGPVKEGGSEIERERERQRPKEMYVRIATLHMNVYVCENAHMSFTSWICFFGGGGQWQFLQPNGQVCAQKLVTESKGASGNVWKQWIVPKDFFKV